MRGALDRRRALTWVTAALVCVLAGDGDLLALNPALEVSQYAHKAWLIRDGFFKGQIRSITQSADGYLWLATEFGVLRFDGVRAVPWEPSGNQHLASSDIWSVLSARDGSLWIGTAKGLARWKNQTLTQYPELAGRLVARLLEDREGTVWAGALRSPAGILCTVSGREVTCSGEDGTFGYGPFGLHQDRKGNLWVGMMGGLWRWRPEPRFFLSIPGAADSIQGFDEDEDHALLFTAGSGLRRVVGTAIQPYSVSTIPQGSGFASHLLRDRDGSLWIGTTSGGLVHLHQGRTDDFGSAGGLSGQSANVLFEDREANIWVATENGLDRFRDSAVSRVSASQGLAGFVTSVHASSDGVWIAGSGGVSKWTNGHLLTYRASTGRRSQQNGREVVASGMPSAEVHLLFHDNLRRTWLAFPNTAFGYLRDERFVEVRDVPARSVRTMGEDTRANVWIADTVLGLSRVAANGQFERTPWSALGHSDPASALAADRVRGGLWLGFLNGGVTHLEDGKVRASYGPADGLAGGWVRAIHSEPDGTLWVAAEGGLSRLHDGHAATLNHTNGLPCDAANWVIADDAGSLWVNMACGLVRISGDDVVAWVDGRKQSISPTVFDAADGVRSESSPVGYSPYVTKAPDGRLWFVGKDGANVLDPRHVPINTQVPPVHIETLSADRQTFDVTSEGKPPIRLPALTRDVQIDYTALSFVAPEKNRFRVQLEGWDSDWIDVGTQRQKAYANLRPRSYRFHVIASNNSGIWNETGAYLDFSVDPAYYQTTWFLAAVVGTTLLLIVGLYRLRVRQVAHQYHVRLEERVNERTRIARDLHDTLLQSFHAVVLRFRAATFLLPEGAEDAKKTFDHVIDDASKAIVDARNAVQDLRASTDPMTTLVDALAALAKELETEDVSPSRPQFILHVEGTPGGLQPLVRDDVYRIAREALRNAFRHSGATRIEVDVRYDRRQFRLRVRDDGKGIDDGVVTAGGRAGHYGLAGMRERADLIGGTFTLWSEPGSGTEIELTIPASIAYAKVSAARVDEEM